MFKFTYRDRFGEVTERQVDLRDVYPADSGTFLYMEGFCSLRKDWRKFRSDRIIGDLVNMETGEVVFIQPELRGPANDYEGPNPGRIAHQTYRREPQKQIRRGGVWGAILIIIAMILSVMS